MSNLLHSWNVFNEPSNNLNYNASLTEGSGWGRQSSNYLKGYLFKKTDLVNSIISRIALDASMVDFKHLKIMEPDFNQTPVKSSLIECLTIEANIDQSGRAFIYDLVWSLLDEGVVAIVPIDTTEKMNDKGSFDILSMRVGKVMQWYPKAVRVKCYNDQNGLEQELLLPKKSVAILESPLLTVLKEQNQTLRLLQQKIDLMYSQDRAVAAGKLNGFIQLPYSTKSSIRKEQADVRKKEIEDELSNSQMGIATLDANEKFIQTGGNITNNLLGDIRQLQQDFYNQTGITPKIIDGTATPAEMNVYYMRTVDPVLQTIVDGINRSFITKTARTQGQKVVFYRDPFRTLPVEQMATTADLFARNAIFTPNEIRTMLGKPPHPDPLANKLYNRNIADGNQMGGIATAGQMGPDDQPNGTTTQPQIYNLGDGVYVNEHGQQVDEMGTPV